MVEQLQRDRAGNRHAAIGQLHQLGRLAHVNLDRQSRGGRQSAGHLGLVRPKRRQGETHVRNLRANQSRRLEKPLQVVRHLLRARAGQDRHQRAVAAPLRGEKLFIVLVPADLVEERMAHEGRIAAAVAEPLLLERQAAQNVVHQSPHFLHPPLCPRPNLRRRVIENRNPVRLGPPGNPPVEARIIHQHHGVGLLVAEVAVGPARQVPELVQVDQHPGKPHHRQPGQIGMEPASGLRHVRAAVTDRFEPFASAAQLPDQVCGVQVPARFAHRKEDPKRFGGGHGGSC